MTYIIILTLLIFVKTIFSIKFACSKLSSIKLEHGLENREVLDEIARTTREDLEKIEEALRAMR